jgi:Fe-S-cluster containining protein
MNDIPKPITGRCPFLDDAVGCTARDARPMGCRTYFCTPPTGYDQQILYEDAISKVKRFIRENDLPYFYVEWIQALKTIDNQN